MRSGKTREGPPGALTRERILDAAKEMFARRGVEAVSLRELTIKAGVNLAAVHYHFGSKEGVLAELFARSSKAIVKWRIDLLEKVRRHPDGRPYLEDVLEAFLRPALQAGRRQNTDFVHLRARLALERDEAVRRILSQAFDASSRKFIEAIADAVPGLPRQELYWRFHFLIGSMFYTMADSGRIQALSDGECDPSETEEGLKRLVVVFSKVFLDGVPQGARARTSARARAGARRDSSAGSVERGVESLTHPPTRERVAVGVRRPPREAATQPPSPNSRSRKKNPAK
jgi:AcrR family transcriptional regulator